MASWLKQAIPPRHARSYPISQQLEQSMREYTRPGEVVHADPLPFTPAGMAGNARSLLLKPPGIS